jgi:vacuolar-type H+-ATPase subunit I/STV1
MPKTKPRDNALYSEDNIHTMISIYDEIHKETADIFGNRIEETKRIRREHRDKKKDKASRKDRLVKFLLDEYQDKQIKQYRDHKASHYNAIIDDLREELRIAKNKIRELESPHTSKLNFDAVDSSDDDEP